MIIHKNIMENCYICDNTIMFGVKNTKCMNSHVICISCYGSCEKNKCCFCRRETGDIAIVNHNYHVIAITNTHVPNNSYDYMQRHVFGIDIIRLHHDAHKNNVPFFIGIAISMLSLVYGTTVIFAEDTYILCSGATCIYYNFWLVNRLNMYISIFIYCYSQYYIYKELYEMNDTMSNFKIKSLLRYITYNQENVSFGYHG